MVPSPSTWMFSRASLWCSASIRLSASSFRRSGSALSGCGPRTTQSSSAGDRRSDLVTSGSQDGLLTVRRFLDGARDGLYMQPNTIDEAFAPYDDTEIVFR